MSFFTVCESGTANFHYHIREVEDGGKIYLGGHRNLTALCGARVAWDNSISLDVYGALDNLSHYCSRCETIYKDKVSEK